MQENEKKDSIFLSDIIRVVKKNIILIALIVMAITAMGGVYAFKFTTPVYRSTSSVVVQVPTTTSSTGDYDITASLRYVVTVADMISETSILEPVAEEYNMTYSQLRGSVSVSNAENSSLIRITVVHTSPEKAQEIANAIAAQVCSEAKEDGVFFFAVGYMKQSGFALRGTYSSPNKKLLVIVAFMAGCALACAVVFVKEFMSNKFKTKDEIEVVLDERVIGVFRNNKKLASKKEDFTDLVEVNVRNMEPYNMLLSNIKYANIDNPYKVIMGTSTVMDELKSTTVANFSNCISNNGKKVIVLDLDLRKPTLHKFFKVSKEDGIVEFLDGTSSKEQVIKHAACGVDLITTGKNVTNPVAILESIKLKQLIEELKVEYDYVIIDTPPVLACSDAQIVSKYADGVVYNVSMNQAHKKDIKEAISNLKAVEANIIGINVVKAELEKNSTQYYYYSKIDGDN